MKVFGRAQGSFTLVVLLGFVRNGRVEGYAIRVPANVVVTGPGRGVGFSILVIRPEEMSSTWLPFVAVLLSVARELMTRKI